MMQATGDIVSDSSDEGWRSSPGYKAWVAQRTLGTNPPEWSIPLGYDERDAKI